MTVFKSYTHPVVHSVLELQSVTQFISGLNLSSVVLCPDGVTTCLKFPGQLAAVFRLFKKFIVMSSQGQFPDSDEICKECHHSYKNKPNMIGLTISSTHSPILAWTAVYNFLERNSSFQGFSFLGDKITCPMLADDKNKPFLALNSEMRSLWSLNYVPPAS